DSPEDAKKRASGDLVRVGDFDVERGLLRGYYGTKKDITVPPFARVIGTRAFDKCSSFIESVDLNKAAVMIPGPFGVFFNCPNLKTVKIPPTMDTITPNMFQHCPNLTVYVRRSQVSPDFEARFTGKGIVFLDEE
ncbi:MAG: leucine-rich repeat protein, partial [Firmicutes bacterium]|nr:leucine-rich repeat protein [Bacillota bacterium]